MGLEVGGIEIRGLVEVGRVEVGELVEFVEHEASGRGC